MPSVLVVEDDGVIARAIAAHLRHAGLDVVVAEDGDKGLRKLRYEQHDVAVVDLMLPGVDGWALTQEARREGIATPILIVSARSSEHDKVHALEIGADDYLAKPFGMRELVARVQALLRRTRTPEQGESLDPIDAPGLLIDPAGRRAFLLDEAGERVDAELTPTEFRLLLTLARQPGRVLDRDELQQRVWNVPYRVPRPLGRRLRAQAAGEARPALDAFVHPDPVRRRLPLRPHSAGHLRRYPRGMATVTASPLLIEDAAGCARSCSTGPERRNALSPGAPARSHRRLRRDGRRHVGARRDRARRGARASAPGTTSRRWATARCRARASCSTPAAS